MRSAHQRGHLPVLDVEEVDVALDRHGELRERHVVHPGRLLDEVLFGLVVPRSREILEQRADIDGFGRPLRVADGRGYLDFLRVPGLVGPPADRHRPDVEAGIAATEPLSGPPVTDEVELAVGHDVAVHLRVADLPEFGVDPEVL
jgi:hypothetical protein